MTKCIAFHSYKGGTGKSTISSNLAALLTKKGYSTVLLDLDVYAPTLHTYFKYKPRKWLNDFLFDKADISDVIIDMTYIIEKLAKKIDQTSSLENKNGKLYIGFSSSSRDEIYKLDGSVKQESSKVNLLRKFILIREEITSQYDPDYIIIDTSPGIRYWSINALAIANVIILSLKMDGIDIEGTRVLSNEIYTTFTKLGTKSYLLMNRIAGYCHPPNLEIRNNNNNSRENQNIESLYQSVINMQSSSISNLKSELSMEVISNIPCYCDIQFDSNEFLTVINHPDHPFTQQMINLIRKLDVLDID